MTELVQILKDIASNVILSEVAVLGNGYSALIIPQRVSARDDAISMKSQVTASFFRVGYEFSQLSGNLIASIRLRRSVPAKEDSVVERSPSCIQLLLEKLPPLTDCQ